MDDMERGDVGDKHNDVAPSTAAKGRDAEFAGGQPGSKKRRRSSILRGRRSEGAVLVPEMLPSTSDGLNCNAEKERLERDIASYKDYMASLQTECQAWNTMIFDVKQRAEEAERRVGVAIAADECKLSLVDKQFLNSQPNYQHLVDTTLSHAVQLTEDVTHTLQVRQRLLNEAMTALESCGDQQASYFAKSVEPRETVEELVRKFLSFKAQVKL